MAENEPEVQEKENLPNDGIPLDIRPKERDENGNLKEPFEDAVTKEAVEEDAAEITAETTTETTAEETPVEQDGLTAEQRRAANPETSTGERTTEDTADEDTSLTRTQNDAARKTNPDKTAEVTLSDRDRKRGYTKDANGDIVWFASPQGSIMDYVNGFLILMSYVLKGDMESFHMFMDRYEKAAYEKGEDAVFERRLARTARNIGEQAELDGITTMTSDERRAYLRDLFANNEFLKQSGIEPLLQLIVSKESQGGEANIVYDYMGSPGLNDGDVTRGGLYVGIMFDADGNQLFRADQRDQAVIIRSFSESTVNEILAWQDAYKDEQRAYFEANGIDRLPSSALGAFQFVGNTLRDMRDDGLIDGDRIFDLEAQTELAIIRMIENRDLARLFEDDVTEAEIRTIAINLRSEWQGLEQRFTDIDEIVDALKTLRETTRANLGKNAFDNARDLDITSPR